MGSPHVDFGGRIASVLRRLFEPMQAFVLDLLDLGCDKAQPCQVSAHLSQGI
jgi:hypothetical protein